MRKTIVFLCVQTVTQYLQKDESSMRFHEMALVREKWLLLAIWHKNSCFQIPWFERHFEDWFRNPFQVDNWNLISFYKQFHPFFIVLLMHAIDNSTSRCIRFLYSESSIIRTFLGFFIINFAFYSHMYRKYKYSVVLLCNVLCPVMNSFTHIYSRKFNIYNSSIDC